MSALDQQKESDVKEYLEKLAKEYRSACYSEKKAEGINQDLSLRLP